MQTIPGLLLLVVVVGCFCRQVVTVKAANSRRFLFREEPCHCESDCMCEQGHCVNNKCQCNFGWAGTDCGIQAAFVPSTPKPTAVPSTPKPTAVVLPNVHHDCGNHGHFNGAQCTCSRGWSGARCQHAPGTRHECYDPSCMHGVCLWWLDSSGHEYQDCHCDDEYVGEHCTYSNHPYGNEYLCADQSVCEHGVCVHNTQYSPYNYYACKCEAGCHGDHCDENNPVRETIFCDGKMCRHGTCNQYWHNGQYQYGCKCDPGWTGDHCDTEEFNRCGNHLSCLHGTCYYYRDRYGNHYNHHCVCTESWYGMSCDNRIAVPTVPLCGGHACRKGTCQQNVCVCAEGWTGSDCDTVSPSTTTTVIPSQTTTTATATTSPTTISLWTSTTTTSAATSAASTSSQTPSRTSSIATTSQTSSTTAMVFTATTAPFSSNPLVTEASTQSTVTVNAIIFTKSPNATSSVSTTAATHAYKACNGTDVMYNVNNGIQSIEPTANQCQSGRHESSEALVLGHCQVDLYPNAWRQDSNVAYLCNSTSPPPAFTPIATFDNGVYSSTGTRAGIFLQCTSNGFLMVFQTCNTPPHIASIEFGGAFIQDPAIYYILQ